VEGSCVAGSWPASSVPANSTGWSVASPPPSNARGSASHRSDGTVAHIVVSASCESVPVSPPARAAAPTALLLLSTESGFKNLPRYNRTKSARLGRMEIEGCIEGVALSLTDGARLGAALREGRTDGAIDGTVLGAEETVGAALMDGRAEGYCDGFVLGGDEIVGLLEGNCEGLVLGGDEMVGLFEGCCDGCVLGGDEMVGAALMDGLADGRFDGPGEGAADTDGACDTVGNGVGRFEKTRAFREMPRVFSRLVEELLKRRTFLTVSGASRLPRTEESQASLATTVLPSSNISAVATNQG
jgi:hypothetical protein